MDALTPVEAFEGWLLDLQQRRRTERTREQYRKVVLPFLRWTEAKSLAGLDGNQLRRYQLTCLASHHPETLVREIGCIKTFGKWLEQQELVPDDPFRKVRKPRVDHAEKRILAPADAQRILSSYDRMKPDQFRDYVIVSLTLDTGLRISEVCGAKLRDLSLEAGWLQVWGKGRKQRRVPLSATVKMLLWKWVNVQRKRWATSEFLFVSMRGGPVDRHRLCGRFHRQVRAAGIPYRVRFHDLRHAAATYALRAGMPKERVSRMLGHANDSITSIYEHLDFEDVAAAHSAANPLRLLAL